jgi:hypothetical protein
LRLVSGPKGRRITNFLVRRTRLLIECCRLGTKFPKRRISNSKLWPAIYSVRKRPPTSNGTGGGEYGKGRNKWKVIGKSFAHTTGKQPRTKDDDEDEDDSGLSVLRLICSTNSTSQVFESSSSSSIGKAPTLPEPFRKSCSSPKPARNCGF